MFKPKPKFINLNDINFVTENDNKNKKVKENKKNKVDKKKKPTLDNIIEKNETPIKQELIEEKAIEKVEDTPKKPKRKYNKKSNKNKEEFKCRGDDIPWIGAF